MARENIYENLEVMEAAPQPKGKHKRLHRTLDSRWPFLGFVVSASAFWAAIAPLTTSPELSLVLAGRHHGQWARVLGQSFPVILSPASPQREKGTGRRDGSPCTASQPPAGQSSGMGWP